MGATMRINKNIKKYISLFGIMVIFSSILSACGKKADSTTEDSDTTTIVAATVTEATATGEAQGKTDTNVATKTINVNLTKDELDYFTKYFSDINNNGFLLCSYSSPKDINLEDVLYSGAGCDPKMQPISDAERKAYLKAVGQDDIYLDLHRITTTQINNLLQEKVGIKMSDVKNKLSWTYLKAYDTYYLEQGDTHYCTLTCVSGYKTSDGIYVIECENPNKDYQQSVNNCEVTLKKSGNIYKFQSNFIK